MEQPWPDLELADQEADTKETFKERLQEDPKIGNMEVNQRNYKSKFKSLICKEERAHMEILAEKYVYSLLVMYKIRLILTSLDSKLSSSKFGRGRVWKILIT